VQISEASDQSIIRDLVEKWVLWRDAGLWDHFRTVWHDDGYMMATWFQGSADEFIAANRQGWERGVVILHFLGGCAIELSGARAIAQTKMTISQRAAIHGVECDVVCTGRFFDFFERRQDRWGLVHRQPIYERDRVDTVDPSMRVTLDKTLLGSFPEGYRHLAYLQTAIGYSVKKDMPGLKGPAIQALYQKGAAWLSEGKSPRDEATVTSSHTA